MTPKDSGHKENNQYQSLVDALSPLVDRIVDQFGEVVKEMKTQKNAQTLSSLNKNLEDLSEAVKAISKSVAPGSAVPRREIDIERQPRLDPSKIKIPTDTNINP